MIASTVRSLEDDTDTVGITEKIKGRDNKIALEYVYACVCVCNGTAHTRAIPIAHTHSGVIYMLASFPGLPHLITYCKQSR